MIFKKNKNFIAKYIFNQKTLALLGLIIIILISFPLIKNVRRNNKINQEIRELEKKITNLENRNLNFKNLISYLESNQFIEEQARLKLGLKKEGEDVTVIKNNLNPENNNLTASSSNIFNITGLTKEKLIEPANNPQKWLKHFFK
ncbi:MAG: septum formation initiator family protein [Patescibacteria group bacterium]|nr:septum formation initiator family protein [Patescibacteria group bacterium]MBU1871102.1 septum formation initiator family protein [Patescibacteria group bacterium]